MLKNINCCNNAFERPIFSTKCESIFVVDVLNGSRSLRSVALEKKIDFDNVAIYQTARRLPDYVKCNIFMFGIRFHNRISSFAHVMHSNRKYQICQDPVEEISSKDIATKIIYLIFLEYIHQFSTVGEPMIVLRLLQVSACYPLATCSQAI